MITNVNNLSRKSFKDYSGPFIKPGVSDGAFQEKNVIFGYNGRGKSSLAMGIIDEYEKMNITSNSYRIFNREYVMDNMLLQKDSSIIRGIKATFGKSGVDNLKEIKKIESDIKDTEGKKKEIEDLKISIRELINIIHDTKKGKLNISRKSSKESIPKVLEYYKQDVEKALKIESDKNRLKSYQGDDKLEKDLEMFEQFSVPFSTLSSSIFYQLEKVSEILKKNYEDIKIPDSKIVSWIDEGVELHSESDHCKFCNNNIDISLIQKKLEEYKKNEKQQDMLVLLEISNFIESAIRLLTIDEYTEDQMFYHLGEESSQLFITALKSEVYKLKNYLYNIQSKIKNMHTIVSINVYDIEEIIGNINQNINTFNILREEKKHKLNLLVSNQSILVKGAIGLTIEESKNIKSEIIKLKSKENKLSSLIEDNKVKYEQIEKLKEKQSEYGDFLIFLNRVLKNIEIDLKLVSDETGVNYHLIHAKSETQLTIDDISEGEKNLLALLFFYFELYEDDKQTQLKNSIKLLVIDDPISSLDDANKFYVLELVKKLLTENNVQIFIMTHSWNDFCQITYGVSKEKNDSNNNLIRVAEFFELFKDSSSNSQLRVIDSGVKPYKKLFSEIYSLSLKNKNQKLDDCDLYHTPNSMRRIFEEFLQFKSSKNILPQKSFQKKIEGIICTATNKKELSNTKKQKLSSLLTIINVLSHTAQYNSSELISSAKFLMSLIEEMDKSHYLAMRE